MPAFERGAALMARGEVEAAAENFLEALTLDPGFFPAARELAIAWTRLEDPDQAEYFTRCALELEPGSAEMHLHLGNLLRAQGRLEEALAACEAAVRASPAYAQAHNNLGNAYRDLGRAADAAGCFRKALELDPALAEAYLNLGIVLFQSGERRPAMECYREALRRQPGLAQASLNLGYAHEQEGESREAMECYARAIAIQPGLAEAHVNYGLQRLLIGDYATGWQEYEWRWRLPEWQALLPLAEVPRWDGSPLNGKTILLYGEQGFGDVIQFARYAPLVAGRGGRVVVRCQPKLAALLRTVAGVGAVAASDAELPPYGLCCSLISLPGIFGTTLETIPSMVPYLRADPEKGAAWRERLASDGAQLKIGLYWATDSGTAIASAKSLALEDLAPLAAAPAAAFYSLQRGAAAAEARRPPAGMRLHVLDSLLGDFADDAALISNLDLVISIDTATAHLAGALGKPVWTPLSRAGEWRWLLDREDSPWYPTMRLFRQRAGESWSGVVDRIAEALAKFRPSPQ